jgi:triple functional domain protein/kalirin
LTKQPELDCVFKGKITAQGKLLLQDSLQVAEVGGQQKADKLTFLDRRVFLFEQVLIFSEEILDKKKSDLSCPEYCCKQYLRVCLAYFFCTDCTDFSVRHLNK